MARMQTGPFHVQLYDSTGNLLAEGPCTQFSTRSYLGRLVLEGAFSLTVSTHPCLARTLSPDASAVRTPPAPPEVERRPCWNCGFEGLGKQLVGQPCKRCGKTV